MMKGFALCLALVMALGLATGASAAKVQLEEAGVTFAAPAGLVVENVSDDTQSRLEMTIDGRDDLLYSFTMYFDEAYSGKWMDEMTQDEIDAFARTMLVRFFRPEYTQTTFQDRAYLLMVEANGTELHLITVLNGWVSDMAVVRQKQVLSDDEIQLIYHLQDAITYGEV